MKPARMITRAHELDPMSMVIGINVSQMYQLQNNDSASIENSRKIIELYPNSPLPYWYLGLSFVKQRRYTEAIESFKKEGELENIPVTANGGLGYVYGAVGKRTEAIAIAKELEEEYARNKASGMNVATVYAGVWATETKSLNGWKKIFKAGSFKESDGLPTLNLSVTTLDIRIC